MEWLNNIPWPPIVFGIFALAVAFLLRSALRRKRRALGRTDHDAVESARRRRLGEAKRRPSRKVKTPVAKARDEEPEQEFEEEAEDEAPEPEPEKPPTKKQKPAVPAPEARPSEDERQRLERGLAKTRDGFVSRLSSLFRGKQLDEALLEQVEEVLFTADIGVRTSQTLIDGLRRELSRQGLKDAEAVWSCLRQQSEQMVCCSQQQPLSFHAQPGPYVVLVVGVNGVGKTTTIGKLAAQLKDQGKRVMLAAGDTFRAAAVDQLAVWGERTGTEVVRGKANADPTSVIIEALRRAKNSAVDVLIADTAGRLHTKVGLMEEVQKVRRAIGKQVDGAPHETFLILDATMGQNAIAQAKLFKEALEISGIILTKLDGTAKGGVLLGICNELALPVRYVGIGEKVDDLRPFDPVSFVSALYARQREEHAA
jgi:fused signal recognition particle receptor